MFCQKCGHEIPDDASFCEGCGAPVPSSVGDTAQLPAVVASRSPIGQGGSKVVGIVCCAVLLALAVGFWFAKPATRGGGDADGRTDDAVTTEVDGAQLAPADGGSENPGEIVTDGNAVTTPSEDTVAPAGDDGRDEGRTADDGYDLTDERPFWGIWTFASKDYDECVPYVAEARARGIDARITTTGEWGNLNEEPWYVVTMGTYATEDEAEEALGDVLSAGYDDAYVKYSGKNIG